MDDVLAGMTPKVIRLYEEAYGVKLQEADYAGEKYYQLEGLMALRSKLLEDGFFRSLPVIADSQKVVQELQKNYKVFITTAAMSFPNSLREKYDWLREYFPFIAPKYFVFCGDKSIIRADYMIDDHSFNLKKFTGKGLLLSLIHI